MATGRYRPNYSGSRLCLKIAALVASESLLSQDRSLVVSLIAQF